MGFNDFLMLSDQDYAVMKQNYDRILEHETNDLKDISNKMQEQRANLERANVDGRYDNILEKLKSNINELDGLINNNNTNIFHKSIYPEIPHIKGLWSNRRNSRILDTSDGAISPIRGKSEMEQHERLNNIDSNIPNQNNNGAISPNLDNNVNMPSNNNEEAINPVRDNNRTNTLKRNSPMQSNFVSNLIKQFNLNWKKSKISSSKTDEDSHRNRFHNIIALNQNCAPHNMLVGSQIDIIRLLLLYLALRPNCKYLSRIATIANDQFDIYLKIESMNQI